MPEKPRRQIYADFDRRSQVLICADAGGSNGNRLRAWKLHLQELDTEIGIPVSVCHYPPSA